MAGPPLSQVTHQPPPMRWRQCGDRCVHHRDVVGCGDWVDATAAQQLGQSLPVLSQSDSNEWAGDPLNGTPQLPDQVRTGDRGIEPDAESISDLHPGQARGTRAVIPFTRLPVGGVHRRDDRLGYRLPAATAFRRPQSL